MNDFIMALDEVKPAFGMDSKTLENSTRGGFYLYGSEMIDLHKTCLEFIKSVKNSEKTTLLTVLLEGCNGSGKTAIAAKLAMESNFLYVKLISPEMFVGKPDYAKVQEIVKIFEDAYKSSLSLVILDDIERLIEYIHIGARFSNLLLQALLILIKKKPANPERKLMIIGTTSQRDVLEQLELVSCFNVCKQVGTVTQVNEVTSILSNFSVSSEEMALIADKFKKSQFEGGIPIKKLLLASELALEKSSTGSIKAKYFMEALNNILM